MIFIRLMMVAGGLLAAWMWYLLLTIGIPGAAENDVIGTPEVVGLWVFAIFSIIGSIAVFVVGWGALEKSNKECD